MTPPDQHLPAPLPAVPGREEAALAGTDGDPGRDPGRADRVAGATTPPLPNCRAPRESGRRSGVPGEAADDLVDEAVVLRLLGGEPPVPVGVALDDLEGLSGVEGGQLRHPVLG